MKDLDFDELDKAVNSLMSGTSTPKDTPVVTSAENVVDITTTDTPSAPASEPLPGTSVPAQPAPIAASSPAVPSSTSSTSLPSRRGGRFMDVVHPSSDMKKPETPRPSRQGITIAPRPAFDASRAEDHASIAQKTPEPEKPAAATNATPIDTHPAEKSEWPDPLEMAGFDDNKTDLPQPKPEQSAPPEPSSGTPVESDAPLTSPFLPNTKVEKRPLGGTEPASEPDHTPVVADDMPKTTNDPNDQLPATPKEVETPLPEEFHHDLVQVEADTSGSLKTEEPKDESPVTPLLPPEPAKTDETPVSTGPTSIPQQYHEEPTTGDKDNGAIYDTAAYHQPLAHPAKKKSGWMWVVWIVVILLVGAGGGAALYLLHII